MSNLEAPHELSAETDKQRRVFGINSLLAIGGLALSGMGLGLLAIGAMVENGPVILLGGGSLLAGGVVAAEGIRDGAKYITLRASRRYIVTEDSEQGL